MTISSQVGCAIAVAVTHQYQLKNRELTILLGAREPQLMVVRYASLTHPTGY